MKTVLKKIYRTIKKEIFIGEVQGRSITVKEDDTFLVSYPKSGNTWTRFLIANILNKGEESITFFDKDIIIPDIYQQMDKVLLEAPAPRILKSHEYFDPRYKKVIYIVRDPRDVAVSYYHHQVASRAIEENSSIESYVSSFVQGHFDSYGTWGENVGSWLGAKKNNPGFLLVKYEDMINDTHKELGRISKFLDLELSESNINRAVVNSSAENMRKLEMDFRKKTDPQGKKRRTDKPFVRHARVGDWRDCLSKTAAEKIEFAWGDIMRFLKYI